jgi:hypothetical protein
MKFVQKPVLQILHSGDLLKEPDSSRQSCTRCRLSAAERAGTARRPESVAPDNAVAVRKNTAVVVRAPASARNKAQGRISSRINTRFPESGC